MQKITTILVIIALATYTQAKSQYKVVKTTKTTSNISLDLDYFGKEQYYLKPTSPVIKRLTFTFQCLASGQFQFKITDRDQPRFQVLKGQPFPTDIFENFSFPLSACGADLSYTQNPFDFSILKTKTQSVLFSTYSNNFIYSHLYIEIGTEIANDKVFGIGERFSLKFRKNNALWTVWNRPGDQQIDSGTGNSTYGYYPFYLLIDKFNEGHINYLKTTSPVDLIKSENAGKHYLTFKIIGGIVNFRFKISDYNITTLVKQFHETCIGKPAIPPFWSLGFHQSRWGYDSAATLNEVLSEYEALGLPLDTIWSDIDYMRDLKDFTIDEENFPLDAMQNIIKKYHYVPIIDAGISTESEAYQVGFSRDVFMKDLYGRQFIGTVWPGDTVFVDYFNPKATQYWKDMLSVLYSKVKFSGIWLDMNEIQNFCDGPCSYTEDPVIIDYTRDLPYQPPHLLELETVSLNLTHYNNYSQFNVHPYFALLQIYATNQYLKSLSKFPFILSRSTTFGSGKYGFHWTGDNHASWDFLRSSIVDNMNINLAGIQMVGPDICGFGGNTTQQLCARWYQLSAVYPFARSHNDYWSIPQQPFSLGRTVFQSAMNNLKLRYLFLKQFYSWWLMTEGTTPFFTSPAFYPAALSQISNLQVYDEITSTQFFILDQPLMFAPILQESKQSRTAYFIDYRKTNSTISKNSYWLNLITGQRYQPSSFQTIENNMSDFIPMFMVEGSAIFIQDIDSVRQTSQLGDKYTILAAFDQRNSSQTIYHYQSTGKISSIHNFSNEDLVSKCLAVGCRYDIFLQMTINKISEQASVTLSSFYSDQSTREPISIVQLNFEFDGIMGKYLLPSPVKIYDNVRITIPIVWSNFKQTSNLWPQMITQESNKRIPNLSLNIE